MSQCLHCGEPAEVGKFVVEVDGQLQDACCPGCQAAASLIGDSSDLSNYYRFRDKFSPRATTLTQKQRNAIARYDQDDIQADFVDLGKEERHATFLIDGISCAACVWLIEKRLQQFDGVVDIQVNLSTQRMQLTWRRSQPLSALLIAVFELGYSARPYRHSEAQAQLENTHRQYLIRLGVSAIGMMQVMMNAVVLYSGGIAGADKSFVNWASLVLTIPVILISAGPFFTNAWRGIRTRKLGMDVPVSLAIGLAFGASIWATFKGSGETYYESVAMFTCFLLIGRYLEFRARLAFGEAGNTLDPSLPEVIVRMHSDQREEVLVKQLKPGDIISIPAGQTIPVDGEVTLGSSEVDQASFTGESIPVPVNIGSQVAAGTINRAQHLLIQVQNTGADTQLSLLHRLVDQASSNRPQIAQIADKVASYFVSIVLLVCSVTAIVWWQIDSSRAFWVALSVLVVTCPCALSLATPTALTAATTRLRRKAVLLTKGTTLEALESVSMIAFDKTGTLTDGQLGLNKVVRLNDVYSEEVLIKLAASIEVGQPHPIAEALLSRSSDTFDCENIRLQAGLGLTATWQGKSITFGKAELANQKLVPPDNTASWHLLTIADQPSAWFGFDDQLRPQAKQAIAELGSSNCIILSGDRTERVASIAQALGIETYFGDLTPEAKIETLRRYKQSHAVMMVGDGLNDAPVLASAHVSVAMSNAVDLAKQQSDVVLLQSNLRQLADILSTARRCKRIIKQNLSISLAYNLLALPAAVAGLVPPWLAAIGMSLSSVVVVSNAMRLRRNT